MISKPKKKRIEELYNTGYLTPDMIARELKLRRSQVSDYIQSLKKQKEGNLSENTTNFYSENDLDRIYKKQPINSNVNNYEAKIDKTFEEFISINEVSINDLDFDLNEKHLKLSKLIALNVEKMLTEGKIKKLRDLELAERLLEKNQKRHRLCEQLDKPENKTENNDNCLDNLINSLNSKNNVT